MRSNYLTKALSILFIAILALVPAACNKKEQPVQEEKAAEQQAGGQSEPAAVQTGETEEAEETVYTRTDPGPWAGKETGHLPIISYEKIETGLKVVVAVPHEMNAEKPHYIMWIKLKDGEGNLIGEKNFEASAENAKAIFELTEIPEKLIAFEKCNLHGIWKDEIDVSTD